MKKEYNFANSKPNPYVAKLHKQISIRLDVSTLDYFKKTAKELITMMIKQTILPLN